MAFLGANCQLAVMCLGDALYDRQTQPGSESLGREERLEDPLERRSRNSRAIVTDLDSHCGASIELVFDDVHDDTPAAWHRLHCVADQIDRSTPHQPPVEKQRR